MSTRQIQECDRCKHEIKSAAHLPDPSTVTVGGRDLDLCGSCAHDLARFLAGDALEIPP